MTPPPTELAGPSDVASDDAVAEVTTFWRQLGATVHAMPAEAHDVAMAWTSHLPHIMASALAASTPAAYLPWVATGWRDTTRIAGGDTTLWNQIVATNRDNLRVAVATLRDRLDTLHTALRDDLPATWELLLREGKERRDSVAD